MKELILAWMLSLVSAFAPPEKLAAAPQLKGWEETAEEKTARYTEIVRDLHEVVYDENFVPIFKGPQGRERTVALVLGIAFHESGFAKDVDKGPCYREGKWRSRCDGGQAACLMQINVGAGTTPEGWTQKDLFADRKKCFKAGINAIKRSIGACRKNPQETWLAAYASGSCDKGHKGAKELWQFYQNFWAKLKAPEPKKEEDKVAKK